MAGHIDEADAWPAILVQIGKPEVDRHAARAFFRQAVGCDAGQRADQGGLAVIDVPGERDDHVTPG